MPGGAAIEQVGYGVLIDVAALRCRREHRAEEDEDSATGGADMALFSIDAATGTLSFLNAPDFETPLDQGMDNTYDVEITVSDGNGGTDSQDIAIEVQSDGTAVQPRLNEIHYDNAGGDVGEFVEVRVAAGADVSALSVELYNGSNGSQYGSAGLAGALAGSDAEYDYYVLDITDFGISGIQNGSPDGLALG